MWTGRVIIKLQCSGDNLRCIGYMVVLHLHTISSFVLFTNVFTAGLFVFCGLIVCLIVVLKFGYLVSDSQLAPSNLDP